MRRIWVLPWVFAAICAGVAAFAMLGPIGCLGEDHGPPQDANVTPHDGAMQDAQYDRTPSDGAMQDGQSDVLLPDGPGDADALAPLDASEDEAG